MILLMAGWFVFGTPSADAQSASDLPSGILQTSGLGVTDQACEAECSCVEISPFPELGATSLFVEDDSWGVNEYIAGQRWYDADGYSAKLNLSGAPRIVQFTFNLSSEERLEIKFAALDAEPLEVGAFSSGASSFRINHLEWDDQGRLLSFDADFHAERIADDPVSGRVVWQVGGGPEEPPFLPLSDQEFEFAYLGQAQIRAMSTTAIPGETPSPNCLAIPLEGDPPRSEVDWNDFNIPPFPGPVDPPGPVPRDSRPRPESPREAQPPSMPKAPGTRVDSIQYSESPVWAPGAARIMIENEVAQLQGLSKHLKHSATGSSLQKPPAEELGIERASEAARPPTPAITPRSTRTSIAARPFVAVESRPGDSPIVTDPHADGTLNPPLEIPQTRRGLAPLTDAPGAPGVHDAATTRWLDAAVAMLTNWLDRVFAFWVEVSS